MAGGKERRFIELLKGLKPNPLIEFELVIMKEEVHYKEVFSLGIKIHFILRKTSKDLSVFRKFYSICKSYNPDIVHCFDSMTAVYLIPSCYLLHIKFINGLVSNAPERLKFSDASWLRSKLTFPFSTLIIGNSNAGLTSYKAPKSKSLVIHNGFDFKRTVNLIDKEDIRRELNINTKFFVGMVASFSKFKDYKTYFKAAESVLSNRKDVTFVAIGSNTDSPEALSLINNEYRNFIHLLGKKSNIESYVNAMDVCILSTFTEGISNSIMEYMALGKPVVATSGGGTNEIVEDGETGFLIKPSDSAELFEKIQLLLDDLDLRVKMGNSGFKRVTKLFSINSMVSKYLTCYEVLLRKGAKK
jgi:glycosyltransferase involved in cell wall biosynthesis